MPTTYAQALERMRSTSSSSPEVKAAAERALATDARNRRTSADVAALRARAVQALAIKATAVAIRRAQVEAARALEVDVAAAWSPLQVLADALQVVDAREAGMLRGQATPEARLAARLAWDGLALAHQATRDVLARLEHLDLDTALDLDAQVEHRHQVEALALEALAAAFDLEASTLDRLVDDAVPRYATDARPERPADLVQAAERATACTVAADALVRITWAILDHRADQGRTTPTAP